MVDWLIGMGPERTRHSIVFFLVGILAALAACQRTPEQENDPYVAEVQEYRRWHGENYARQEFAALALVHREYMRDRQQVTVGSGGEADVRLQGEGIAPVQAVIHAAPDLPVAQLTATPAVETADGKQVKKLELGDGTGFRLGRYHLRYIEHVDWGPTVEVYDPELPGVKEFSGFDWFPIDAGYKVGATIAPADEPEAIHLIDSQGNQRPYYVYGELRFRLADTPCTLEVYSPTVDPEAIAREGFMLMFTDETSGRESYPASRYLDIEGVLEGPVAVDFNLARSPPCNYSAVYTCPFPRAQNRLPVAVRAGQKWYRGKTDEPARPQ